MADASLGALPEHLLTLILARSLAPPSVSRAFHGAFLTVWSIPDLCAVWVLEKAGGDPSEAFQVLVQHLDKLRPPATGDACAAVLVPSARRAGGLDSLLPGAARHGFRATVLALLAAGADVHAEEDLALAAAAGGGHTATVEALLSAGADVHARQDRALIRAAFEGHTATLQLLLGAGADIHAQEDKALGCAVFNGHTGAVEVLLGAGANVHVLDAISCAALKGHTAIVQRLMGAGAVVRLHVFYYAAHGGHADVVQVLLDAGAVPDLSWPLGEAARLGHTGVVKLLLGAVGAGLEGQDQKKAVLDASAQALEPLLRMNFDDADALRETMREAIAALGLE